ncbi:esterase-like activity of phytase family protein [Parasphingopyxis algicola]|uniref:esterase-like activity of phytase family protein n=1 Tax=Parasphingopyxis algicola TaxID=2026624 RepID=UPI0015A1B0FE|nr:esterase-like activity of phytase family protein [Parasphingopyxis algicola]QLC25324.1 esterase-like activity of phytase family protein [Parasphingopyxis algicola]
MIRRIAAALSIFLIAGSILVIGQGQGEATDRPFAIYAEPVVLDPADPGRRDIGRLRYLGGWVLGSDDPDFGGISAMALAGDGFVAISDAGGLFRFALDGDAIARAEIAELPAGPVPENDGPVSKRDRDAEALAHDPATGRYWVAFERADGVWRFDADFAASDADHAPDAMEDWPNNGGAEAMVRFDDGRFLIFSEAGDGPGDSREVFLFSGDPSESGEAPVRLGYRPPGDHRITDAALLPDGRLIVLNRDFSLVAGVSVIVSIVALDDLTDGAILTGEPVARLDPPLTIDNMEALAVDARNGRTIVWMASDDNFNPLQRSLLLQFELIEDAR